MALVITASCCQLPNDSAHRPPPKSGAGSMAHAAFGLRVKVNPSFFSRSRTLDAMETDSCMPTTAPQFEQHTAPTSTREPVGLIGMDANSVPSHFGHLGVTDFITVNGLNEKLRHRRPAM